MLATAPVWHVAPGPGEVADAAVDGRGLIAVGTETVVAAPDGTPVVWLSQDGSAWSRVAPGGTGRMTAVVAAPAVYIAAGERWQNGVAQAVAWTSPDGLAWRRVDGFETTAGCSSSVDGIAAGSAGYVAVGVEWGEGACGQHAAAWASPDGTTWARATIDAPGNAMRHVVATGDGYVAAGANDARPGEATHAMFWTSPDGRAWTASPDIDGFSNAEPATIAVIGDGSVLASGVAVLAQQGVIQPALWRTSDGRRWERVAASGFGWGDRPTSSPSASGRAATMVLTGSLVPTERGIIALGAGMTTDGSTEGSSPWRYLVWTSADGRSWSSVPDDPLLAIGRANTYVRGPEAVVEAAGRLLLFGSTYAGTGDPGSGPARSPSIWTVEVDALLQRR